MPDFSPSPYAIEKETRYLAWCDRLERRYDAMPPWYWNATERRRRFEAQDNPGVAAQAALGDMLLGPRETE
jgi:hypothetical protein